MANNSTNNQNQASVINIENIVNVNDKKQSIFFEIPPYQRLYEWNKEQIQILLNDIKTKFDENKKDENKNKEYFIGNVVVSKKSVKKDQNNDVKHLLIDGQQRLTTLFLIGFFLSYKNPSDQPKWKEFIMQSDKLRISMPIREKEEEVLKEFAKFCNKDNKDNERRKNDIFLQKLKEFPQDICQNIPQALEIIVNWFEENIENNDIEGFSNFIYEKVKFVFVELAENTDLNRFFIRMNNRGKQLEKHEILKARLLSKFNDEDESKRTLYAHIWDICSQMDNYIFQKASDRVISKSNESSGDSINNIIKPKNSFDKPNQNKENQGKFKSIVDFPTFLLHVYKLTYLEEHKNEISKITIDKNKLLEIIKIEENTKKFIENLLKYRILFDYFVIKSQDDMENSYKIRRLSKEDKAYTISEKSNVMPNLAMVQNYLRVARSGMSNNHHHWLTPFLKKLDNYFSNFKSNNIISEIVKFFSSDFNITSEKFENNVEYYIKLLINNDNLKEFYKNTQSDLIHFLEILDTALAKEQLQDKVLIDKVNEILNSKNNLTTTDDFVLNKFYINEKETQKCILDQGTATPHYWFYRLEYYLWKNRKDVSLDNYKLNDKNFSDIASNFYFRSLNSIEHVQAQSKAQEWGDNADKIDNFGNLALISSSFNSSLNNQDTQDKYLDLQKYINKDSVISLKLWLIYALSEKKQSKKWTFGNAQTHKEQMLEILKKSF
ncbi:DUF262 domain-containing protein [Campylobacter sp. RKI_CA19_01122]|uniref:DUF262 domain-containing protein n=1 Tax=Campylobacter sp. RKI_CA19_01122 TaxID=2911627 RepID=UPI0021E90948|nr:DUF262 domain-containing protein [Campylobacter sp. RKI_CA19_01122]MCV3356027.1 DUF262 domain-containing protein [Campylobacter sp. RKI_CA19_01122]